MTGRGPLRPRPRAPPGGAAPLPSRRNEAGGVPRASRRRPRRPYGAFTFLVGHGAAGGARRPRGSRRGRLSEAGGRFLRSLLRPLRPRLRLLFPAPAACGSRRRAPLRAPTPTNQRPRQGGADQSAEGKGRGRQRARWSRGAGSLLGAAIFRSALSALLKGPRPALRGGGFAFGSRFPVLAPGPGLERTGGCGSSGQHSRG